MTCRQVRRLRLLLSCWSLLLSGVQQKQKAHASVGFVVYFVGCESVSICTGSRHYHTLSLCKCCSKAGESWEAAALLRLLAVVFRTLANGLGRHGVGRLAVNGGGLRYYVLRRKFPSSKLMRQRRASGVPDFDKRLSVHRG